MSRTVPTKGLRWAAALALCALSVAAAQASAARPPNLIVILCDNLGYGDVGAFGSKVHRTPNLDRMATEGIRFTHFYASAGVCTPSRASLMTGCYAQRIGLGWTDPDGIVLRPVSPNGLHPAEVTVAEILRQQGYTTTMIGKWHLGDQPLFLPTRQGFDSYFGIPYSDDMTADKDPRGRWPPLPLMENERVIEAPVDRNLLTKRYTQRALSFIEANRRRPFFLYLAHAMPGSTTAPFASEAFRGRSANGPWGDAVEEIDWSTARILAKLRQLDLDRRTLVLWTSDNGAPAHTDPDDLRRGSNRPLCGPGYTTSEGAMRVPAIFWWPGTIPAGKVCHEMATLMDVLPTFACLAGALRSQRRGNTPAGHRKGIFTSFRAVAGYGLHTARWWGMASAQRGGGVWHPHIPPTAAHRRPPPAGRPGDRSIDGKDIRPLIFAEQGARSPHRTFYYYYGNQLQAVRAGPWKLFLPLVRPQRHPHHRGRGPSPAMLFNVVEDVGCERNVAQQCPDVVRRLSTLAEHARTELGDVGKPGPGQRRAGRVADLTPRVLGPQKDRPDTEN